MNTSGDSPVASRLLRAILAKSFIEAALLCLVATLAAFSHFSPLVRGALDVADATQVAGWVYDPMSPGESLDVQLFIDGAFVAAQTANEWRDDLVRAGVSARPNHGFLFRLDGMNLPPGAHTAQVFALRNANGPNKTLVSITRSARTFQVIRFFP